MNRFCSSEILRISKAKARTLYKKMDVYVLPNLINPDNMYMPPVLIPRDVEFSTFIISYTYFNCNKETGRYCAFYVDAVR